MVEGLAGRKKECFYMRWRCRLEGSLDFFRYDGGVNREKPHIFSATVEGLWWMKVEDVSDTMTDEIQICFRCRGG